MARAAAQRGSGRHVKARSRIALLAAALSVLAPGTAVAGTAAVVDTTQGRGDDAVQYVSYTGAPGEANRVTARLTLSGGVGTATVTDSAGAVPGRGCSRPDPANRAVVTCRLGNGSTTGVAANAFSFDLGDRDDLAEIVGSSTTSGDFDGGSGDDVLRAGGGVGGGGEDPGLPAGATLKGGAGNDVLEGGPGDDLLDESARGATGSDTLRGGSGTDTVTYAGRRRAIRADLADDRDDGQRGERDLIDGAENLEGGRMADRLTGDRRDNRLVGGGGSDVISGGRGADNLHATTDDFFPGSEPTRDRIAGGSGMDYIVGTGGANRIDAGPDPDTVYAGGGPDRVRARDRATDDVQCGRGRDIVAIDALDTVGRGCERIRRRGRARAVLVSQLPGLGLLGSRDRPYADPRISCPADLRTSCRVTVVISRRGTVFGTGRARVGRGTDTEVFVYLNEAGRRFAERGGPVRLEVRTRLGRVVRLARYGVVLDRLDPP